MYGTLLRPRRILHCWHLAVCGILLALTNTQAAPYFRLGFKNTSGTNVYVSAAFQKTFQTSGGSWSSTSSAGSPGGNVANGTTNVFSNLIDAYSYARVKVDVTYTISPLTNQFTASYTFEVSSGSYDYFILIGPSDTTRSKTECIKNNSGMGGWAYWKVNGTLKNKTYLPPGGFACYTMTWTSDPVTLTWGCDWIEPMDPIPPPNSDQPIWRTNSIDGGNYSGPSSGAGVEGSGGGTPHTTPMTASPTVVNSSSNYTAGPIQFSGTGGGATESTLVAFANAELQGQKEREARDAERAKAQLDATKELSEMMRTNNTSGTNMTTNDLANLAKDTRAAQSNTAAAWISGNNATISAQTNALGGAWGTAGESGSSVGAQGWQLSVPIGGQTMTASSGYSGFQKASELCLAVLSWACAVALVFANMKHTEAVFFKVGQAPQATTAGESVLGNNVNMVSAFSMGIAIVSILAALPALFAAFMVSLNISGVGKGHMFQLPTTSWPEAISLAANFIPFGLMLACGAMHFMYRMACNVMGAGIMGAIRLLSGI